MVTKEEDIDWLSAGLGARVGVGPGISVGAEDGGCTEVMKEFVAASATNAEFREIEGAGHLPMVEKVDGEQLGRK